MASVDEWGFVSEGDDSKRARIGAEAFGRLAGNVQRFANWKRLWHDYETAVGQVAHRVLEASLEYFADKNLPGGTSGESRGGRLMIINLAAAWKGLAGMQAEFRRWFSRHISGDRLAELDRHERATFRHLWPVAQALVHAPTLTVRDASQLEAQDREARRDYLNSVKRELTTALGPEGSVNVEEGTHDVNGKACLLVVCDSPSCTEAQRWGPEVVTAFRRAANGRRWAPWSATPIEAEWSHIAVVWTVKGKAVASTGALVSTAVLIASEGEFVVQPHHTLQQPMRLTSWGIDVWELPLLSAALAFQASYVLYLLTALRLGSLVQFTAQYKLCESELVTSLESYSTDVARLQWRATGHYSAMVAAVEALHRLPAVDHGAVDVRLRSLRDICEPRLAFPSDGESMTIEGFTQWAALCIAAPDAVNNVVNEVVDLSIAVEGAA
jgi:hypothetical protein